MKKKTAKKTTAKKPSPKKTVKPKPIGKVTHYFGEIKVGIVKFSKPTKVGASIRFLGATTDFEQAIQSLQYDHKAIATAPKGKEVGMKVKKRVREGDQVFLVD